MWGLSKFFGFEASRFCRVYDCSVLGKENGLVALLALSMLLLGLFFMLELPLSR